MNIINYKPIGIIHSPFKIPKGTPIQPPAANGVEGVVEVFKEYSEGLDDLEGFSYIILIYHFHLIQESSLKVVPYMDKRLHGVFSTRAPKRPNPIGFSIVELKHIKNNILYVRDIDIIDGTPLIDIKPYVPEFDEKEAKRIGWLMKNVEKLPNSKDDGRFIKEESSN